MATKAGKSRREFLKAGTAGILAGASGHDALARILFSPAFVDGSVTEGRPLLPKLAIPLAGNIDLIHGQAPVTVTGPHRFLKIGERTGLQALTLETKLKISTTVHRQNTGSLALWLCPLESLAEVATLETFASKDPCAQQYNLVSDDPSRNLDLSTFAWQWESWWWPTAIGKFNRGWRHIDIALPNIARVMVEHLRLRARTWYQLVLTWNFPEGRMRTYVNGMLAAATNDPFHADEAGPDLYIGNSAMVFSGLEFYDQELTASDVVKNYTSGRGQEDPDVRAELLDWYTVHPTARLDWSPDRTWHLAYAASFTKPQDVEGWSQQGSTTMKELRITSDGWLMDTPDELVGESEIYLWSPKSFEGDIAVQFDFRPERATGLALLVAQASGMQREDFLTDQPRRTSGDMSTIVSDRVRNYHWEFFRKTSGVRSDLETQLLAKNPWRRPLGYSCLPNLELGEFHHLLFLQEGRRLRAVIDNQVTIDVEDDPYINMGPVFNCGRIGLRVIYQTRMTFRNLKVWNRKSGFQAIKRG